MTVGRICIREVLVAAPEESVREVARRMRDADVGTVVVVDPERRPVGMVTDRDLVLRCVAEGCDAEATAVSGVMTAPVTAVRESTPIETALARMAGGSVRRLVVTDDRDRLAGILALDDVLELLVEEAELVGRLLERRHPPPAGG